MTMRSVGRMEGFFLGSLFFLYCLIVVGIVFIVLLNSSRAMMEMQAFFS